MKHFSLTYVPVWLVATLALCAQSCTEQNVQLEKTKIQFALTTAAASGGRVQGTDLPDRASLRVTIKSISGTAVLSQHEVQVLKTGDEYRADPIELLPGNYLITDFMIVDDGEVIHAAPKTKSPLGAMVMHSLPYRFSVDGSGVADVRMQVLDARQEKPESFGYASFKTKTANKLSFIVSRAGGSHNVRNATAELRQGKTLISSFQVKPGANAIRFEGEPDAQYTLSVFAGDVAKAKTFNFKQLKQELGGRPMEMALEPALLLSIESFVDEENEYDELFSFVVDGTGGNVNVNWGNGHENALSLPFDFEHEYTYGTYTAIVTGDLDRITNLFGFSYGTIIMGIEGLTNTTGLKTYNPSWGAVPIKVDLSKCNQLETIYIEKHGAPYEPVDLTTDFKLPATHFISEFVFYASSLDPTRENITPEELEVFVDNIYHNTTQRGIYGGKFFVYPTEAPSPAAQAKLDILQSEYGWDVRLDGNIWDDYTEEGRTKVDLNVRRDNWLKEKFPDHKRMSRSASVAFAN